MIPLRRATLRVAGTVAIAAAVSQITTGTRGVRGFAPAVASEAVPGNGFASLDSELRFYAVWYGVAGLLMHRAARDEALDRALKPILAGGWAAAAMSRVLSARHTGRPDPLFMALGGAEAVIATVLATTS